MATVTYSVKIESTCAGCGWVGVNEVESMEYDKIMSAGLRKGWSTITISSQKGLEVREYCEDCEPSIIVKKKIK